MNKIEVDTEQLRYECDEFFRELPKIQIGKKMYYKDDRLQEFRNIHNPHDRISFEEFAIVELAKKILNRAYP